MNNDLRSIELDVYDMLVIRDKDTNVYQECIERIENGVASDGARVKAMKTANFTLEFINDYLVFVGKNIHNDGNGYYIEEVFKKVDDDTFKCVYRKGDKNYAKQE